MNLDTLGKKYGTDKSSLLHGYLEHYELFFPEPDKVKTVVEIGLQRGGKWAKHHLPSLNMWAEFFPNASIYGADIKPVASKNPRVTILQTDTGNVDKLCKLATDLPKEVDFIIDDGSHIPSHQLFSFLLLWPKIKPGGIFIIEDCNAQAQKKYPLYLQIHCLIQPYINGLAAHWITSKNAGEYSSLIIKKPIS